MVRAVIGNDHLLPSSLQLKPKIAKNHNDHYLGIKNRLKGIEAFKRNVRLNESLKKGKFYYFNVCMLLYLQ